MRIEDYPDNLPGQMTIYDYDECLTDDMKWEKAITHFNEVQKRYACLGFSSQKYFEEIQSRILDNERTEELYKTIMELE